MSFISAETQGNNVVVWERAAGVRSCIIKPAEWAFYVQHPNGTFKDIHGHTLKKLSFKNQFDFYNAKREAKIEGYKLYDSDVSPDLKYVSKNYFGATAPDMNISFYDIEIDSDMTRDFKGAFEPIYPITAISLFNRWNKKSYCLAVPPPEWNREEDPLDEDMCKLADIILFNNERELLIKFLELIEDCDCLVGFNSDQFDDPYITQRVRDVLGPKYLKKLAFENGSEPIFKTYVEMGMDKMRVTWSGRTQADYMQLIKKFEPGERQSYALASIAQDYLPHLPKLTFSGNLEQLYRDDFPFFVRYSIRDSEILEGLENKLGYVAIANMLRFMSTGYMKHIGGTVKLADLAVRNYIWYKRDKLIVQDYEDKGPNDGVDGAYVMDPVVGFHVNIAAVDIRSLYPSVIMGLNISPEKLIGQFLLSTEAYKGIIAEVDKSYSFELDATKEYIVKTGKQWKQHLKDNNMCISGHGTVFSMDGYGIFPSILSEWFAERVRYKGLMKTSGNNKDDYQHYDRLQYIFKIKLNSYYGSLLNAFFRYFDPRLGASVTGSGREILHHQASQINLLSGQGYTPFDGEIVYGDTDSCYFTLPKDSTLSTNELVMIADEIGKGVNESFPGFMTSAFLTNDFHSKFIECTREIVASGGIFVTKKRYILHIIDKEGKRCDEAKVMGLDLKKSNLPVYVQETLTKMVIDYIKGKDWKTTISDEVIQFKNTVRNNSIMDIGIPKGVKKIEHYTQQFELLGMKARLPGHTAASIFYNIMRKHEEAYDFPAITSGSKIRVFKLKQKIGKFKSIALPRDIEDVPEWFEKHVEINIEEHVKSLIDNPLNNIMFALGLNAPTEQSAFLESFLEF